MTGLNPKPEIVVPARLDELARLAAEHAVQAGKLARIRALIEPELRRSDNRGLLAGQVRAILDADPAEPERVRVYDLSGLQVGDRVVELAYRGYVAVEREPDAEPERRITCARCGAPMLAQEEANTPGNDRMEVCSRCSRWLALNPGPAEPEPGA